MLFLSFLDLNLCWSMRELMSVMEGWVWKSSFYCLVRFVVVNLLECKAGCVIFQ
jgi:hypothetical protein